LIPPCLLIVLEMQRAFAQANIPGEGSFHGHSLARTIHEFVPTP
jgi:hypothetical protein